MEINKKIQLFIVCLFVIFEISLVSSVQDIIIQTNLNEENSLKLEYPQFKILKENVDFNFQFHVFNSSSGFPIYSGLECSLHLYNSTGYEFFESKTTIPINTYDYSFNLTKGNFTTGSYSYLAQCNNSISGGFVSVPFKVTKLGDKFDTSEALIYFVLTLIFLSLFIISLIYFLNVSFDDMMDEKGNVVKINYMKYMKFVFGFFSYMLLLILFVLGKELSQNILYNDISSSIFHVGLIILLVGSFPLLVVSIIILSVSIASDKRNERAILYGE